jgi:repressor of nif and glnA expression|tara:strand:- start:103 stop:285 length:183 start_codon:yes stop_codon:yes gene_type:complete
MTELLNKLYDLEILKGDYVYIGSDIKAKSIEEAIAIMKIVYDSDIDEESEIIHFEEKTIQ